MTARFAAVSSRLSSMRASMPQFHSVELGGTTQIMDAFWIDQPGTVLAYTQSDDEGEASRRVSAMRIASRLDGSTGILAPEPGLYIAEETTLLADVSGNDVWCTQRWTLAWVDPSAEAGKDNAGQMIVAHFIGAPVDYEADPDRALAVFQVAAATGSWAAATNLLVVADPARPGTRRVFVARTLNRQGGSVIAAETLPAALGGV